MSIDQMDVVDAISTDRVTGSVALTIMDHLPWDDVHLAKLEQKLAVYVRFVESGQILESYPNAIGRALRIRILIKYRPDASGLAFLERAHSVAVAQGFGFEYGPIPDFGYDDDL